MIINNLYGQGHNSVKTQNLLLLQYITNYSETTGYIQFRMMDILPNRLTTLLDTIMKDHTISSWRIQENTGLFLSIKFSSHDMSTGHIEKYYKSKPPSAIHRDTERQKARFGNNGIVNEVTNTNLGYQDRLDTQSPKFSTPNPHNIQSTTEPYLDSGYSMSYIEDRRLSQQHNAEDVDLGERHNVNPTSGHEAPQVTVACQCVHDDHVLQTQKSTSVQTDCTVVQHDYTQTVPKVTKFKRIQVTPEYYSEDTQTKYIKTYDSQSQTTNLAVNKSCEAKCINMVDSVDQTDSCIMVNRHIQTFYKGKSKSTQYKVQRKAESHPKVDTPACSVPISPPCVVSAISKEKPSVNESGEDQPYDIYKDPRWDLVIEKLKILDKYDRPKPFVSDVT